ncbi:MAG: alpha-galactosidase, partial [Bacteroidaceae bacterium]|nr:alpha-galactosidase [Bacteroidaceae bacterium]
MMGVCANEHLLHLYYGKRLDDLNAKYLIQFGDSEPALHWMHVDAEWFNQMAPFEYSAAGTGDFRDVCLQVRDVRGYRVSQLKYDSYRIYDGKPNLPGLPATFGDNAQTLEIKLKDEPLHLSVLLRYSVFEDSDALLKSVEIINDGTEKLYLEKALSGSLSMPNENYELSTLHGTWARERHIVKRPVTEGKFSVASVCGKSSHVQHPFMMLTSQGATQTYGEAFGMNFIYSGNFLAETELNYQNSIRMTMGIHPDGFEWVLEPGASFVTPELVTVYSSEGIGNMTRTFHDLYRNHLIRSPWLHKKRPILVNNWEATYFNFDQEKLYAIAQEAAKLGVEMLVMDDGWFGKRYSETTSLGDWVVNEEKIPDGLKALVDRINALGMKF